MYGDYGGRRGGPADGVKRFFLKGGIPVTLFLLISNVITFFLVNGFSGISQYLVFSTVKWPQYFWTSLTWPLIGADSPINLIFALGWFFTVGGSLERSWGSRVFGNCVVATSMITALALWAASAMLGTGYLAGLWVLSGATTVAWALSNKHESFNIWGLPLPAPALVLLGCAIVWYFGGAGYGNPLIGLAALINCAAAWWYVTQGRYGNFPGSGFGTSRGGQRRPGSDKPNLRFQNFERETADGSKRGGFNLARWWRERQEKKRLEAMFRRSGYTDPEERRKK